MSTEQERSLKKILIDKKFQIKFLWTFVFLFIITTISLYSTTFLFFWNLKEKGLSVGIPEGHVYYQFLMNQKKDLDILFIGLALLNFFLLIGTGLVFSHRMAGPLQKIKAFLKSPEDFDGIQLRENDFFQELVPIVNKLKDKIK